MITKKETLARNSLPQPQVDVCGEVSDVNDQCYRQLHCRIIALMSMINVTDNFTVGSLR